MTHSNGSKSCTYSHHLGPIGCLPAPNIFPLTKETFAKGKMFWNCGIFAHKLETQNLNPKSNMKKGGIWGTNFNRKREPGAQLQTGILT